MRASKTFVFAELQKLSIAIPSFAPNFTEKHIAEIWTDFIFDFALTESDLSSLMRTAATTFKTFPSIAELKALRTGANVVSSRSVATVLAEGIWTRISRVSPYSEPLKFWQGLNDAQRAAVPSPAFAYSLADLTNDDKNTQVAQWRDVITAFVESNPENESVIKTRLAIAPNLKNTLNNNKIEETKTTMLN